MRDKPLDIGKFSAKAANILVDFSQPETYQKFVSKEFLDQYNFFMQRPIPEWLTFELFQKTYK